MSLPSVYSLDGLSASQSKVLSLSGGRSIAREIVISVLRRRGHEVDWRSLLMDAPADFDDYELVVMELEDNDPDGLASCRRLRDFSKVPVLVLVPGAAKSQGIRALEIGADSFMLVPFDRRELIARAEALIRRYRGFVPPNSAEAGVP